ncbi:MAG: transporter substrate-binding domain-containing protein [Lachnospiraceae bacterium]|nr:transporter substrate-binding domain-containing protein [Lachnospiraceae bacterium]
MKKRIVAALCAAMMVLGLSACGAGNAGGQSAGQSSGEDKPAASTIDVSGAKLMSDGVLSVGCEVGYPPFEDFAEDGTTPIGYDIDIITAVAEKLGLKANIINTAWDGIFAGIGVNYDVTCSAVTITPERQETMIFSTPYINNYQAVVLLADDDRKVESFNDLDGLSIALQKETTSDILMSDYKSTGTIDVQIVANEKVTSCFTQLQNGEVDAVVVDSTVADGYINSSDAFKIVYKDESEPEQFGIAMAPDNTELQKAINQALAELEAEGFIKETYDYWFGATAAE